MSRPGRRRRPIVRGINNINRNYGGDNNNNNNNNNNSTEEEDDDVIHSPTPSRAMQAANSSTSARSASRRGGANVEAQSQSQPQPQSQSSLGGTPRHARRKACQFHMIGRCRYTSDSECSFSHEKADCVPHSIPVQCRNFEAGFCRNGPLCLYLHEQPEENGVSEEDHGNAHDDISGNGDDDSDHLIRIIQGIRLAPGSDDHNVHHNVHRNGDGNGNEDGNEDRIGRTNSSSSNSNSRFVAPPPPSRLTMESAALSSSFFASATDTATATARPRPISGQENQEGFHRRLAQPNVFSYGHATAFEEEGDRFGNSYNSQAASASTSWSNVAKLDASHPAARTQEQEQQSSQYQKSATEKRKPPREGREALETFIPARQRMNLKTGLSSEAEKTLRLRTSQYRTDVPECTPEEVRDSYAATCSICLEPVKKRETDRFGLLKCDHAFCLNCIREWRSSYRSTSSASNGDNSDAGDSPTQEAKSNARSCPLCRTETFTVLPYPYLIKDAEKKQIAMEKYMRQLAWTHCKAFNRGRGKCSYGSICLFLHAYLDGSLATDNSGAHRTAKDSAGNTVYIGD